MLETQERRGDAATLAALVAVLEFQVAELQARYRRLQHAVAEATVRLGNAALEQEN